MEPSVIRMGGAERIFPNHVLYQRLGYAVFTTARSMDEQGHEAALHITALMAGVGIGLFWMWTWDLRRRGLVASSPSASLATPWAFWRFSTDAYCITPSAAVVVLTLPTLPQRPQRTASLSGFLMALAVLFWRANIFLVPVMALGTQAWSSVFD